MYIDRIKDATTSHRRAMVVEVLGCDSGFLAVISAIAGGADAVMIPEFETRPPYACRSALRASLLGACTLGA